jgi:hypothetical protein
MPAGVTDQLHIILYIWFALLGFNLGVLIALLCCRLDRVRAERSATKRVCSEPEAIPPEFSQPRGVIDWIELPSGAQVCCGDCYARLLLSKMDQPPVSHFLPETEWPAGEQLDLDERRSSPAHLSYVPRKLTTLA